MPNWFCEDCEKYFVFPKWAQHEVEEMQSFVEVPYCPFCGSYNVVDKELESILKHNSRKGSI